MIIHSHPPPHRMSVFFSYFCERDGGDPCPPISPSGSINSNLGSVSFTSAECSDGPSFMALFSLFPPFFPNRLHLHLFINVMLSLLPLLCNGKKNYTPPSETSTTIISSYKKKITFLLKVSKCPSTFFVLFFLQLFLFQINIIFS